MTAALTQRSWDDHARSHTAPVIKSFMTLSRFDANYAVMESRHYKILTF